MHIRFDIPNGEILKACQTEWEKGNRFVISDNFGNLWFQSDTDVRKFRREFFPVLITPLDMFEIDHSNNNPLRGRFS